MATYNQFQQLYCLSAASNAVGTLTGTEADLQAAMNTTLTKYIPQLTGSWKVTWGPRVFKSDPNNTTMGPDNAWFAAIDETQELCVVAVAGTSGSSIPGWCIDFNVNNVVDFTAWTSTWSSQGIPPPPIAIPMPGKAYASQGTCIGVYNILNNESTLAASGQRLGDYIRNLVLPTGYKVIFTGHSMGGAVAPTAALGLLNAKMSSPGKTSILPSAGATPGNEQLVQAFTAAFPPGSAPSPSEPYAVFNTDFFNTLDIVPQAWSLDPSSGRYMNNINNIYSNAGPLMKLYIKSLVAEFSKKPGVMYEPIAGTSFTGPEITPVVSLAQLKHQILIEHTTAYWTVIGITSWVREVIQHLVKQPGIEKPSAESFVLPGEDEVKGE